MAEIFVDGPAINASADSAHSEVQSLAGKKLSTSKFNSTDLKPFTNSLDQFKKMHKVLRKYCEMSENDVSKYKQAAVELRKEDSRIATRNF